MSEAKKNSLGQRSLLTAASGVLVIAGMKAAGSVIVPILTAAFIAILAIPPVMWLQRKGLPDVLAVLITFLGVAASFVSISMLVGQQLRNLITNLPEFESQLRAMFESSSAWLAEQDFDIGIQQVWEQFDVGSVVGVVGGMLRGLADLLTNVLFVMVCVIFMMIEAAVLPKKLRAMLNDPDADLKKFSGIIEKIQGYLLIKTWVSIGTGIAVSLSTWMLGLQYPLLWGVLAFLFNYVPTLGSILAAVPAVLLALVQLGWERALMILAVYFVINTVIGNGLEPRLMGRRLGLSTLVVFLSLVFWGWVWGPVGMLLSVPLTMLVKILLEQSDDLRWLGILLGSSDETSHHLSEKR